MAYTFKHGDRPIDGITVQRAVGRGGFGEVYYALTDSGKQLAVKYLRDNPEVELRGIAHVMNLKSPYLITIYDVRHSEAGDPYVIMEYVSGPSLRELLIAEPNGLGPQKAAFFIKGIANGLGYLHERGIVHRDLKPGNIFYDDGYVKIGDYGLSKHIAVSAHSGNTISVGTVHYMAPEIGSGSYTKSIDIYALGVMLYEMLTGRLPFTGSSMGEVLMRHLSDQPDISGIPEPFASVIAKALAKDPKDRYQDVDEMVEALTSISEVSEGLASFDASVLAQTPRTAEPAEVDRTRTTPPKAPPVPALDARADRGNLPPIPPIPAVLDGKAARKARKLQDKARKLQQKMEKKGRVVHAKLANLGLGAIPGETADRATPAHRNRWRSFVIALIVLFAVAGGLGVGAGRHGGEIFGTSLLFLLGGTLGALVAYALSVRRNAAEHDFQDRLLFTACGFVFMLPAFAAGMSFDDEFARLLIPLTATLVLFNWTDRIQMGRRQVICGWTVFWHGVVATIIAPMVQAEEWAFAAGPLAAGMLVLAQSVAGLWPLATGPMPRPAGPRGRGRGWRRFEGTYQRVASAIESVGERLDKTADRGKAEPPDSGQPAEVAEQKVEAAETQEHPQQPMVIEGYQPSFVGRTANAGLSFMAKLLLLAGLTVAVLFSAKFTIPADDVYITYGQDAAGRIVIAEGGYKEVDEQIPRGAVAAPLLLGSVLLIVARRHDGTAHFVRGFFGCALACLVAILVLGPAADEMELFLSGDWCSLETGDRFVALIWLGALVTGALLLLFWPKPTRRGDKPIVI